MYDIYLTYYSRQGYKQQWQTPILNFLGQLEATLGMNLNCSIITFPSGNSISVSSNGAAALSWEASSGWLADLGGELYKNPPVNKNKHQRQHGKLVYAWHKCMHYNNIPCIYLVLYFFAHIQTYTILYMVNDKLYMENDCHIPEMWPLLWFPPHISDKWLLRNFGTSHVTV